jgi:hypothetical protein
MNNPLAGTDPTGYMGCAASKIDTVCARTDANHGGFTQPGEALSGKVSANITVVGNTAKVHLTGGNGANQQSVVNALKGLGKTSDLMSQWTDKNGNSTGAPKSFDGSETASAVLMTPLGPIPVGPKSPEQMALDEKAALALDKKLTSVAKEIAGSFGSPSMPPDDEDEQEFRLPTKADSNVLRNNLIRSGWNPKDGDAAHHLVAGNSKYAAFSRSVLNRYKIDINSAENGMFLPHNKRVSGSYYHRELHTKRYYAEINDRLSQATNRSEAISILRGIRSDIVHQTFPF